MSTIEKVIKENQEEFMDMVIKFVNKKTFTKQRYKVLSFQNTRNDQPTTVAVGPFA